MAGSKVPKDPTLSPELRRFLDDVDRRLTASGLDAFSYGKQTIWVPAAAMKAHGTSAPAAGTITPATQLTYAVFDFDQSSAEYVNFSIAMPKSWDEGTLTFIPYWTASAGSGTVRWVMQAVALSDDDALNTTHSGASVNSDDTLLATDDLHIGPESSALTPRNTAAENDLLSFVVSRDPSNDTLNADARLIGIKILYTVNAANDD